MAWVTPGPTVTVRDERCAIVVNILICRTGKSSLKINSQETKKNVLPNARSLNCICIMKPTLVLPESPYCKAHISFLNNPLLFNLFKEEKGQGILHEVTNVFPFPGSVSKYLNCSTMVFLKSFCGYLAKYHQEWLNAYLLIGSAPVLWVALVNKHLRKSVCTLPWSTGFWFGNESKKSKHEICFKWLNVTSLLIFYFCVLSPVIINTAFLIKEKIIYNGMTDKPQQATSQPNPYW